MTSLPTSLCPAYRMRLGFGQVHVSLGSIIHAKRQQLRTQRNVTDNFPAAGRRPLSSIAPTIIEHLSGRVYMSLGGSGGSRIYGSILQVILNHMHRDMDISQAVEEPRVHDQLYPLTTSVETTFWEEGLEGLRRRGHNVSSESSIATLHGLREILICISMSLSSLRHQSRRCGSAGRCSGGGIWQGHGCE